MPDFSLAYLDMRRSSHAPGGIQSCGGVISSTRVYSQTATGTAIPGIAVLGAAGNNAGAGTLSYTASGQIVVWTHAGGQSTPPLALTPGSGRYTLQTPQGQTLFIDVTSASLPGSNQNTTLTIADIPNNMFDNVEKSESWYGSTEYRCFYFVNMHPTETAIDVRLWIGAQPSNSVETWAVGLDPAGKGNGSTTGVAATILNEKTAPALVTFTSPTLVSASLIVGDLTPGEARAWWLRRTTPAGQLTAFPTVSAQVAFRAVV